MDFQEGISDVIKAANFAAVKHRQQKRLDPEETPYINHPIGVANILVTEGKINNPIVIQAALLHDTVEDTDTTFEEIEKHFGIAVRNVVAEVTDDKTLPKLTRKELQIEHASTISYEAKLVKLADKLYNLRDLTRVAPKGWTEERVQNYFVWASKVVKQLQGTNKELEEELNLIFNSRGILLNE
ncbi:Guanosine-3',5'-bis(diphosphate) 3'-pyrophosphohydrolase MESH1 [Araneus ventricosus]|uniref:Guanosine-3',5'-bis(diphosphate) 3'-pyrophosphohydrolase MESH1 n=1 Tax=Araneus ventricosus TaxID=182803 RepID=A0A4Y2E123_ARAVE|nr:Guanosine-3',5'-bis(diphosphate) 3'-pyrophosphohydrolase MESH1 [Araneus ventricosus]